MSIIEITYFWARTIPLRPAVIEPNGAVTYAALAHAVEAAAAHFARNVVDRSKPVAVWMPTGSKMLVAVLGLLRAGFNVVLASRAVIKELPAAGASTVVCERDGPKPDSGGVLLFDDAWISFGATAAKFDKPLPHVSTPEGDIICFTSGTTGRPKTVICPARSWQRRVAFPLNSVYAGYERMLIVPGLTTSWGLSRAYEVLYAGRTVCLAASEQAMLWMINAYDIDTVLASPQQAVALAAIQEKSRYPLSALKSLQLGASAISPDGIARIHKSLCRNVTMIYGSTEAGVVALAPYDLIAGIPGAVGFIMPGVGVEIVDDADRMLPTGQEGLVRVRSPVLAENTIAGVAGPPWFYPGDLGRLGADGMLCVGGRVTDVLNRGGEKFSITDFENFLLSCPGVKDAGLCTVMGESGHEEAWLAVVLDPAADMAVFRHAVGSNATFAKNIDKLFVVESVPRGTLGKIQRNELKTMLQALNQEAGGVASNSEAGLADAAPPQS
jgi:acyl-coenzyme A synthetase/AMP-(fatty) acid ligase